MARPRQHADDWEQVEAERTLGARRQRVFRQKTKQLRLALREFLKEFDRACARGQSASLLLGLPEEDTAAMEWLAAKLRDVRIIVCKPE